MSAESFLYGLYPLGTGTQVYRSKITNLDILNPALPAGTYPVDAILGDFSLPKGY